MFTTAELRIRNNPMSSSYFGPAHLPCCLRVDGTSPARRSARENLYVLHEQGHPMVLKADDSEEGREFDADAIFTRRGTLEAVRTFYADVKSGLAKHGRSADDLEILPAAARPTERVRS